MNDYSPAIKQFAAEHEKEIKEKALAAIAEYYDRTTSTDYEAKWDKGCKEHGDVTAGKLFGVNWLEQRELEAQDAFWYTTLDMFQQAVGKE